MVAKSGTMVGLANNRLITIALATVTLLVLVFSAPSSLREAWEQGGFYLFSRAFFADIPARLTGPGRLRFIIQPFIAALLGIRSGRADAVAGRPPYLSAVLFHPNLRREFITSGFHTLINLLLMGILLDAVFQWIIFGVSHPAAALVVGPLLIIVPYVIARSLANCH